MEVRVFNIRMSNEHLITDQNRVNDFLKTVQLKKSSTQFIEGKENIWSLLVYYEFLAHDKKSPKPRKEELVLEDHESKLADHIRQWRQTKAEEEGISSYMVLTNKSILALAKFKPTTTKELLEIHGIGEIKAERYGKEILDLFNAIKD